MSRITFQTAVDFGDAQKSLDKMQREMESLRKLVEDPGKLDVDADAASKSIRKATQATDDFKGAIGSATDSTKGLNTALVNAAAATAVFTQLGEGLRSIGESGIETRESLKALQVQTGATAEEFGQIKARANDAFVNGVGTSVAEAVRAIGTADQMLGDFLAAEEIDVFTKRASALGKAYDKDVNEILAKSRTFIKNFEVSGQEAGDIIAATMRDAGTGMDDVLDTMDEYSQLARQAGFDAKEFSSLLITGVQAGTRDTDKLADSLKEAQIRLKAGDVFTALDGIASPINTVIAGIARAAQDGEITTKEYLTKTTQAIEGAFSSGEISESVRTQLQVAVAGTPAEDIGSDVYARVFGAPIPTSEIEAKAREAGQQVDAAFEPTVFEKLQNKATAAFQGVASAVAPAASAVGSFLTTAGQLGPGLTLASTKLSEFGGLTGTFSKLSGSVASVGGNLLKFAGPVAIIGALVAVLIAAYKNSESFREAVDGLVEVLQGILSNVLSALQPAFDALGEVLAVIGEVVGAVLTPVFEVLAVVLGGVGEVLGFVAEALAGVIEWLEDAVIWVEAVAAAVADELQPVWEAIVEVWEDVVDFLEDVFVAAWEGLLDIMEDVADFVSGVATAVWSGLRTAMYWVWEQIQKLIDSYVKIWTWIKKAASAVVNFIVDVLGLRDAFNAVKEKIDAVIKFIKKLVSDAFNAIKRIFGAADQAVADASKKGLSEEAARRNAEAYAAAVEKKLQEEAEDTGETVDEALAGGLSGAGASTAAAERKAIDLYDTIQGVIAERGAISADIEIEGATDELERLRLEYEKDLAKIEEDITKQVGDVKKQIVDSLKLTGDDAKTVRDADVGRLLAGDFSEIDKYYQKLTDEEKKQLQSFFPELSGLRQDLERKAATELEDAREELFGKSLDAEIKRAKERRDAEVALIEETRKRFEEILSDEGSSIDDQLLAVGEIGAAQLLEAQLAFESAIDAAAAEDEALRRLAISHIAEEAQLRETLAADGALTEEQRAARLNEAKLENEREYAAARAAFVDEQLTVETSAVAFADRARRDSIEETNSWIDEQNRKLVEMDNQRKRDQMREENTLFAAALAFREGLYKDHLDALSEADKARLEGEKKLLDQETAVLSKAWSDGSSSYSAYVAQSQDLAQRRAEIEAELAGQSTGLWAATLQKVAAGFKETLDDALNGEHGIKQIFQQAADAGLGALETLDLAVEKSAVAIGAAMGEAAAQGESIAKAAANTGLSIALEFINAMMPAWVAGIFGSSFAAGPFGVLAIAGFTATLTALVGAAKSSLSNASFATGGYTGDGGKYEPKGTVHGGEFVFTREVTRQHRALFTDIHTGMHPLVAAMKHYGGAELPALGVVGRDEPQVQHNRDVVHAIASLNRSVRRVERRLESIEQTNSFGRMSLDVHADPGTVIKAQKKRDLYAAAR